MKKITSALLFCVTLAFTVKAQCPDQSQMVMIGVDTNTVFNIGQPNANNIPSVMSCTSTAFCVYPRLWSNSNSGSIYQPCIRTRYNLYYTSLRNNLAETYFQNGGFFYDLHPANIPADRIGGATPPASGTTIWNFSLFQISTAYTHSISVCNAIGGPITTDSISIRDCWRNSPSSFVYAADPAFATASSCLTWSDPANSGTLGTTAWNITPAAVWPAIYAWTNGMCYIDPRYLTPGTTYTLNYSFTPPAGASPCGTYTANYIFTVTNPYTATWTAPSNLCNTNGCVNLTTTGTPGGTWSGTGVVGSQFCPGTSGAGSWPVTYSVGISSTCRATQTNTITVNATPTLAVTGGSICSGQSIVLTNTGSSASGYTWSPSGGSASSATVSPTSNTTYTLTGANSNCSSSTTAAVNVTATPTLAVTGGTICSGQSIVLTNTGSAASGYTWSPSGGSASSATVSPTGNTTYTLTGANGTCTGSTTAAVTVNATPTLAVTGGTICSGQSIVLTNTGTAASGYTWSPSGGSAGSATVSPTGNTTYTLTGANGSCTGSITAAVTVNATPTLALTGGTICSGQSIVLTNTGTAASGYTWSPSGGSTGSATVSPTSNTTYTLTGANGTCTTSTTAAVTVNATPTLAVTGGSICSGQSIVLTNTGSSASGYTWSPSGGSAGSATVSPSGNTTYTLTGANGTCTASTTAAVNVSPTPTIALASSAGATICSGTSTTLTASGATNYTWSPNAGGGSTNPVVVSPGTSDTYTVTGESSGCTSTQVITVNVTPTPTVAAVASTGTLCAGQSTVLTASGAGTYTWMPGSVASSTISVTPGSTTIYTVTGENSGCTSTQTVAVNVNALPNVAIGAAPSSLCTGQTTTLTASGATSYTWSANAGGGTTNPVSVSPSATDTYTVTGTDNNGCINQGTITVNMGSSAVITITPTSNTVCAGGSITLTGGGATNYTWSPGGQTTSTITVTPSGSTTYTLDGNSGGCVGTETIALGVVANPTVATSASSATLCSGASATITGSGATNYTWMPGGATTNTISVTPGSTATYTVTGETGGCTDTDVITINVTTTPTVTAAAASGTICAGQSVVLTGGGAGTYTWMPGGMTTGSATVSPSSNTTYTLTGANGACTATETVAVNVTALPSITASSSSNALCGGQSAVLTAGGATTYTWMPGGANTNTLSVNPATSTVYTVTGTSNGCDNATVVSITVTPTPTLAITASSATICAGLSTTLNGAGATNYTWMPGGANSASTTESPATSTTYTVTGETNGCVASETVAVVVNPTPTLGSSPSIDSALCGMSTGGVTNINVTGGTPGYTYQWYNGSTPISGANTDSLTGLPIGTYSVLVTDANGCVASGGTAVFNIPGSGAVTAAITPVLSQGQAPLNVTFANGSTGATVYNWTFGNGNSDTAQVPATQVYTSAGTYVVTLFAYNGGCWDTTIALVIVDMPTAILIPNIFSPNGDGINDDFFIFNTGLNTLTCDIFNRWGQRMYTLNSPQQVWDGKTPGGEPASEGTYYYILHAVGIDGKVYDKQGPLTLVK